MRKNLRSNALPLIALLGLIAFPACGSDDNGDDGTEPSVTGSLRASATADGSPLVGVAISLFQPGASNATSTRNTGSDGSATFVELEPGTWEVEVDIPDGMDLSAGQASRLSATVTAGQTATVGFSLEAVGEFVVVTLTAQQRFEPAEITISPGTTVRWVNEVDMGHTVTPDGHSQWTSASLTQEGETFTHTFGSGGTFDYFCQPHQSAGMTGRIVVQ